MFKLRTLPLAALLLSGIVVACDDDDPIAPVPEQFVAALSGANEVPAVTSAASGSATFTAVGDTALTYTITANNITGVTMGHIHAAAAGVNGGVVAWLLPPNGTAAQPASGALNGQIATGRINASWIRGLSGAAPITLDSLKSLMRLGRVYVNIHTSTNGGGEIRGQIVPN